MTCRFLFYLSMAASAAAVSLCACWSDEMCWTANVTPKNTDINTKKPTTNLKNDPVGVCLMRILYNDMRSLLPELADVGCIPSLLEYAALE